MMWSCSRTPKGIQFVPLHQAINLSREKLHRQVDAALVHAYEIFRRRVVKWDLDLYFPAITAGLRTRAELVKAGMGATHESR